MAKTLKIIFVEMKGSEIFLKLYNLKNSRVEGVLEVPLLLDFEDCNM